jgi:hypothetical protein
MGHDLVYSLLLHGWKATRTFLTLCYINFFNLLYDLTGVSLDLRVAVMSQSPSIEIKLRREIKLKTELRGLSSRANCTDQAPAAYRWSLCQRLRIEVVTWSAWRVAAAVFGFLDRNRYFLFQVASQLYSWGWVDPVPDPLLLGKSSRAGNRTRELWSCSQELWSLDHRGLEMSILIASFERGLLPWLIK